MIRKDEDGDRWLACDSCQSYGRDTEFWGIGLSTNKLVRSCAASLDGWRRRRILTELEPDVKWIWLDLCDGCASPEGMAVLAWAASLKMGKEARDLAS